MREKSTYTKAFFAILLASFFGGGNGVFLKIAAREIPPYSLIFFRFALAFLIILPFFLKEKPKFTKDFYKVVLFSLLPAINIFFYVFGLLYTTAIVTTLIGTLIPILAVIFSYFLFKEKINGGTAIGIAIGFIGAIFLIFLPAWEKGSIISGSILGNVLILISDVLFALYIVLSKKFQKQYSPVYLNTIFIGLTGIIALGISFTNIGANFNFFQTISIQTILSVLYLALLGLVVTYFLFQYAIKEGSPTLASMLLYLQVLSTVAFASILLKESLTPVMIIGGVLTITGAYIVNKKQQAIVVPSD